MYNNTQNRLIWFTVLVTLVSVLGMKNNTQIGDKFTAFNFGENREIGEKTTNQIRDTKTNGDDPIVPPNSRSPKLVENDPIVPPNSRLPKNDTNLI